MRSPLWPPQKKKFNFLISRASLTIKPIKVVKVVISLLDFFGDAIVGHIDTMKGQVASNI